MIGMSSQWIPHSCSHSTTLLVALFKGRYSSIHQCLQHLCLLRDQQLICSRPSSTTSRSPQTMVSHRSGLCYRTPWYASDGNSCIFSNRSSKATVLTLFPSVSSSQGNGRIAHLPCILPLWHSYGHCLRPWTQSPSLCSGYHP